MAGLVFRQEIRDIYTGSYLEGYEPGEYYEPDDFVKVLNRANILQPFEIGHEYEIRIIYTENDIDYCDTYYATYTCTLDTEPRYDDMGGINHFVDCGSLLFPIELTSGYTTSGIFFIEDNGYYDEDDIDGKEGGELNYFFTTISFHIHYRKLFSNNVTIEIYD